MPLYSMTPGECYIVNQDRDGKNCTHIVRCLEVEIGCNTLVSFNTIMCKGWDGIDNCWQDPFYFFHFETYSFIQISDEEANDRIAMAVLANSQRDS